ncbi:MAG TPA: BTAD domain-containing putative transcriptional regulator [Gemmatimonadaceae bacterium]|jgi:serine/threonine-protein kinase|nr:BTAD domain-containing putative transcriptional regulator [Gemmatimonadaceae bacterium]
MVQLRTLGRLELVTGEPTALHVLAAQPKPLALLAYLALATPRGQHARDSLLALFWPELGDDEARRALRQALHRIRYHVGDELLKSERDGQIGIADDGAWCDAIAFEQALDAGEDARALGFYQGAFLDAVFVSDASPEFEQWVDLTRARLCERAAKAAGKLADDARRAGDLASEVRWATQACRLAPDDEARVRALMSALSEQGDRAGALRVFKSFAERMEREYDAEPAAETTALADSMRGAPTRFETALVVPPAPIDVTPKIASDAAVPTSPESPPINAERFPPASPRARRWRVTAALCATLALIAVLAARFATAVPTTVDRILVADFHNHTRDSLLSGAITEAMRADLSQSRRTRVMSRAQVQAVLEHMRQPTGEITKEAVIREVAERYGVKAFVTGDVASLGSGYTVSAELIAVKSGETLVSVREDASDSSKLLAVVDKVSDRLRRGIGESLWTVRASAPLEQVTTSSLQALRLYSQAIRVGDQEGDTHRAVEILRQAVTFDTSFAMAYRKLGVYLRDMGAHAASDDALARAFRNRNRLPELERYNTAGSYYASVALPDSAIATYRALLALYPTDMRGLNNLASVYMDLREYARAESLYNRAIESDSTVALLFNHLATVQLNGGHYDAADRTLAERARRFPPAQDAETIAATLSMMRGDFDGATARTHRMLTDAGTDAGSKLEPLKMLGTLALIRGQLAESDRDFDSVEVLQAAEGSGGGYLEAAVALAFCDIWYRHDRARGLALLDSAVARYPLESLQPLDRNYATLAYVYALGGRPARARELLADVRANERVPGATRGGLGIRDEGTYLRALGATEIAEGKPAQAVVTLRQSVNLYFCPTCTLPDLARALELAGNADSAIAVYQRYVTTPWSEWQNALGEFRVTSYQRIGELNEARGDTAKALVAYDKVAALWGGADAELQPVVATAQKRALALRAATRVAIR